MDQASMKYSSDVPIEVEKKYRITAERRAQLVAALEAAGATIDGEDDEENIIYGGGVLENVGAALRIRTTQHGSTLTLKKRLPDISDAKHQVEYETEISDPASLDLILRELRFVPHVIYEKRRVKYRFRSVEIVIDELPFGEFVEIEGPLTAIVEAELLLGIDDLPLEPNTYPNLTRQLGKRNGAVIEARF